MSVLVLRSTWWGKEGWLLCLVCFLVSRDRCVALPRGTIGLSAVRDCVFPDHTRLLFFEIAFLCENFKMSPYYGRQPLT